MSIIKHKHQAFIDEMIKGTDQISAYKVAYPKASDEAARVNSYKLLQNATIATAIRDGAEKIRLLATHQAATELKEEIKANVLTAMQKREILQQIATGAIEIPVKKPVWDKVAGKFVFVSMMEIPDYFARMKAIEIDNRMSGHGVPDPENHSHITNILNINLMSHDTKLQFIQLLEQLERERGGSPEA